ncbi:MAG: LPS translocon maturation chaperone LptM [Rubrivivax sp.]
MKTPRRKTSVSTRSRPEAAVRRTALGMLLVLAALSLGACGQKGPLTLTPKPVRQASTPPGTEAGEQSPSARPAPGAASAPPQH